MSAVPSKRHPLDVAREEWAASERSLAEAERRVAVLREEYARVDATLSRQTFKGVREYPVREHLARVRAQLDWAEAEADSARGHRDRWKQLLGKTGGNSTIQMLKRKSERDVSFSEVLGLHGGLVDALPGEDINRPRSAIGRCGGRGWSTSVSAIEDADGYDLAPDPLMANNADEFVAALRELREWAGSPSFRVMARRCGRSASWLCGVMKETGLPRYDFVVAFVTGCGLDEGPVKRWVTAWRRIAILTARARNPAPSTPRSGTAASVPIDAY